MVSEVPPSDPNSGFKKKGFPSRERFLWDVCLELTALDSPVHRPIAHRPMANRPKTRVIGWPGKSCGLVCILHSGMDWPNMLNKFMFFWLAVLFIGKKYSCSFSRAESDLLRWNQFGKLSLTWCCIGCITWGPQRLGNVWKIFTIFVFEKLFNVHCKSSHHCS